ncbi:MAG TPA: hypothetical protein VIC25_03685 [Caulobacteraceae bacterium]|jgi:hypothetical protein
MKTVLYVSAAAALMLAGCDGHKSAVSSTQPPSPAATASAAYGGGAATEAAAPLVNGKPMWAANRKHSAAENAQYQFTRNGSDFGAGNEGDYVTKVHAFVDSPPSGAQTIDRSNGDRLIYDQKSNTFAVVTRDGAPRTMFKPRDGASYWAQQKQRESERATSGSNQS